jgi:hypothetical protein
MVSENETSGQCSRDAVGARAAERLHRGTSWVTDTVLARVVRLSTESQHPVTSAHRVISTSVIGILDPPWLIAREASGPRFTPGVIFVALSVVGAGVWARAGGSVQE